MKAFWNRVLWVVMQTLMFVLAWYGIHGNGICWNMYRCFAWFSVFCYTVAIMAAYGYKAATRKRERS